MKVINMSNLIPVHNYGVYFYLVGSLLFFFQEMATHDIPYTHTMILIFMLSIFALIIHKSVHGR